MELEKAAGALGAWAVGVSLADVVVSDDLFGNLHDALLGHEVLFLRNQDITPLALQSVARRFGQVEVHPAYPIVEAAPDVQILESTAEVPSKIEAWHSDMTFRPAPPAITLLQAQIAPPYGGDTLWASATAAYDALSEPMQKLLEGLYAIHDFRQGFQESLAEPGGPERLAAAIESNPPVRHPLVRTHPETGRRAIFVNSLFTAHIEGLTPLESRSILNFLYQHVTTDEFTVRLNWKPGTVAIWDNRSTQHKPINDYFPMHRRMYRVTIAGDRPV